MAHRMFAAESNVGLCQIVTGYDVENKCYVLSISDLTDASGVHYTTSDAAVPLEPQQIVKVLDNFGIQFPERLQRDLESDLDGNMLHQNYGLVLEQGTTIYHLEKKTCVVFVSDHLPMPMKSQSVTAQQIVGTQWEWLNRFERKHKYHPWIAGHPVQLFWCTRSRGGSSAKYFTFTSAWEEFERDKLMYLVEDATLPI
jgi:hypothetical protein